MSLTLKRVIMAVLGLLGALMLWPILLTVQRLQVFFPSYLLFSVAQGVCLGLVFGALFGSFEGIVVSSRAKAFRGLAFGALFGAASGALGVLAGQGLLFLAGAILFRTASARLGPGLAAANGAAWVIIGTLLAMTEGLRARSPRKLLVGLIGGFLGGLAGGAALSAIQLLKPRSPFALLAGLAIFGFSLSLFYSILENRFQAGALKLLNGPLKGKEYPVVSRKTSMGSDAACDVVLKGYPEVQDVHALVSLEKGKVYVRPAKGGVRILVNDEPASDAALRPEDVIAVGKAKFLYGYFG